MIELTYKKNVEKYVNNNLEVLEDLLDKAAQKYIKLKNKKNKLDFGQKLTPKNLESLAPVVIAKTMDYLEVKHATDCYMSMFYLPDQIKRSLKVAAGTFIVAGLACSLDKLTISNLIMSGMIAALFGAGSIVLAKESYANSSFDYKYNHLMIGAKNTVNAVGSVAHEYTHCLQHYFTDLNIKHNLNNPIIEGHARGLEGIISEKYAQDFNNEAYNYLHSERVARELKIAYLYTCNKKEITPKKSLKELPIPLDSIFFYIIDIDHYSLGVTAMTIASAKNGDDVYKKVMKNDFDFLKIIP